jgi:multimeric flavodoxin WrbA
VKITAFNGSPRRDGNTVCMIRHLFEALNAEGIETEMVQVGGNEIHGCLACYKCFEKKNGRCSYEKDIVNDCIEKMRQSDGIILASPTYFADLTPEIKALMDRAGFVNMANGRFLKRKIGAAVVAVRRGGAIHAFDSMNHLFLICEMIIPGSCYWNVGIGREKGDVETDEEGIRTMRVLGENIAWLMKNLDTARNAGLQLNRPVET